MTQDERDALRAEVIEECAAICDAFLASRPLKTEFPSQRSFSAGERGAARDLAAKIRRKGGHRAEH